MNKDSKPVRLTLGDKNIIATDGSIKMNVNDFSNYLFCMYSITYELIEKGDHETIKDLLKHRLAQYNYNLPVYFFCYPETKNQFKIFVSQEEQLAQQARYKYMDYAPSKTRTLDDFDLNRILKFKNVLN